MLSDGFTTGLPGICADCFKQQTAHPHARYYCCKHNQRLVRLRGGFWETSRGVASVQIDELIEQ